MSYSVHFTVLKRTDIGLRVVLNCTVLLYIVKTYNNNNKFHLKYTIL